MSKAQKLFLHVYNNRLSLAFVLPICPTHSSISVLPKCVAPRFLKLIPCLEQFPLRPGSLQCNCPCPLHREPRMDSQMIPASISGKCLRTLQKDLQHWRPCQSMSNILKIQACPLHHNPSLWPCGPHQLHMCQLYTAPQQSVTIALIHCVGTRRTQGELQFGVAFVRKNRMIQFPWRQNLTFDDTLPILTVRKTVSTHVTFGCPDGNLPCLQK